MIVEAASGALSAAAALAAWGVRGKSAALFGPSVWRGARDRRSIALTFDDGPSESTPELLEILTGYGVPATFFQCGMHVRRLPEVAREVQRRGHEIGNHTESHPRLYLRSPAFIEAEVARAQESIHAVTGAAPALFRAPYGARWFGLDRAQRKHRLLGVMWTVIGCDWKFPAHRIADRLLKGSASGAILCLHDGRETSVKPDIQETVEAVRRLIPRLLERGFRFESVSQILCPTT